jgi:two-component system OmpR family sensor kinase/two-component system sensor histidine kinase QseC
MTADPPRGGSLRRRLLGLLVPATAGLWLLGTALLYLQANHASQQLFDRSLAATAGMLLRLTEHEIDEDGFPLGVALIRRQADPGLPYLQFQIWTPEMRAAARTGRPPATPLAALDRDGYGWTTLGGQAWRTYSVSNPGRSVQIQVAEAMSQRRAYSASMYQRLALLAALWIPLTALLIGWILKSSFAPLGASARAVAARSPEDLRPVQESGTPAEVAPLIAALNRLLERMRNALQMERRFTSDAAHELRSPLAAIRANAQVMQHARSPAELSGAAGDLVASVDRSSRLIDQLLLLARLDGEESAQREFAAIDVAASVHAACDEQRAFAATHHVTLQADPAPATIRGSGPLLAILLRNLLDNAIRYSPSGGNVQAGCRAVAAGIELTVSDQGAGIPAAERAHIFDRFYRVGGSEQSGSGLGLSIVRRIAELHGAGVEVRDAAGGGTCFVVTFPA